MLNRCGWDGCQRYERPWSAIVNSVQELADNAKRLDGESLRAQVGRLAVEVGGVCSVCAEEIREAVMEGEPAPCGHAARALAELAEELVGLAAQLSERRAEFLVYPEGVLWLRPRLFGLTFELCGQCAHCAGKLTQSAELGGAYV